MREFYLLIAGSRGYNNYAEMKAKTDYFISNKIKEGYKIHIVSGGARGADALAKQYAIQSGFEYHEFPADWNRYGKSAGYIRNRQIHIFIAQYQYRGVLCFWDGKSRGTKHNFGLAETYKTPLRIVQYK